MKINVVHIGMVAVIAPEGRLDAPGADEFEAAVKCECERSIHHFVVDLKKTEYISSAGIRVLLRLAKTLLSTGGQLRIVKANPVVHDVFMMANLESIFSFYVSLDQALQDWKNEGANPSGRKSSPPMGGCPPGE